MPLAFNTFNNISASNFTFSPNCAPTIFQRLQWWKVGVSQWDADDNAHYILMYRCSVRNKITVFRVYIWPRRWNERERDRIVFKGFPFSWKFVLTSCRFKRSKMILSSWQRAFSQTRANDFSTDIVMLFFLLSFWGWFRPAALDPPFSFEIKRKITTWNDELPRLIC